MTVNTKAKGMVEVSADHILSIPEGIFGFEDYTQYALIDSEYEPFIWLQSTEKQDVAFLIVDPFLICSGYEPDIDDESLGKIGISKPEDIIIMTIVTVPSNGGPITANFAGPLVINKNTRACMQVILNDNRWSTKVDIMKMLQGNGGGN